MAKLDSHLKSSPTCSTNSIESIVIYQKNKTDEWLRAKPEEEKVAIIEKARLSSVGFKKKLQKRKEQLLENHLSVIKERESAVQNKKQKLQKQEEKIQDIIKSKGIWTNEEIIISNLKLLKTKKEKICALKEQLNIMKTLIKLDPGEKYLIQFSSKGKPHNVLQLTENLIKLQEKLNENMQSNHDQ